MTAQVQREITATEIHHQMVKCIFESAERIKSDVNGNPRYFIHEMQFTGADGRMYRPAYATKYRGKRNGWTFQSYNLKRSIEQVIENQYGVQF